MVLAAALISLAVLAPQAPAQAAPQAATQAKPQAERQPAPADDSKPYTVDGVRRAAAQGNLPSVDTAPVVPDRRGYGVAIATFAANLSHCGFSAIYCGSQWAAPVYPTWNDQFLAMTGPEYSIPYTPMNNSERVQALASSVAIGLAFQAIASLIHDQVVRTKYERKQQKIESIRAEIRTELDELERVNAAARGSGPTPIK